ncbi:hypothetical protein R1flu_023709 [Riccia fluitans]|uniref:Uncharacterized protein n=1 Tax=Riccia fluitans TaxID=41844 RepID=A0ABD1XSS9_9MARC
MVAQLVVASAGSTECSGGRKFVPLSPRVFFALNFVTHLRYRYKSVLPFKQFLESSVVERLATTSRSVRFTIARQSLDCSLTIAEHVRALLPSRREAYEDWYRPSFQPVSNSSWRELNSAGRFIEINARG